MDMEGDYYFKLSRKFPLCVHAQLGLQWLAEILICLCSFAQAL